MLRIREQWGAAIAAACANSSVPQAFLAALIANESGGDANLARFEPSEFALVCQVFSGLRPSLQVTGISNALGPLDLWPIYKTASFAAGLEMAKVLASSFGLTQIMSWHFLALGYTGLAPIPASQLDATLRLMAAAAPHFDLDLAMPDEAAVAEWFTWWNCGNPAGKTFDPNYESNGVERMLIYAALLAGTAGQDSAAVGPIQ